MNTLIPAGRRLAALTLIVAAATLSVGAFFPFYLGTWQGIYPSSMSDDNVDNGTGASCQLCHRDDNGGDPFNAYGWELKEEFEILFDMSAAIVASASVDSDGDGTSNGDEIAADTQPGWTDGANNTIYFEDGSTQSNQSPPGAILGDLDPAGDPWMDLGNGLAGTGGIPLLQGMGTLQPSSPITISLTGARPNAVANLVVGWQAINLPFYCGTLVPAFSSPNGLFVVLATNGSGDLIIPNTWPTGVPTGFTLYLQYWIDDPASICGLAASNAVSGTTP